MYIHMSIRIRILLQIKTKQKKLNLFLSLFIKIIFSSYFPCFSQELVFTLFLDIDKGCKKVDQLLERENMRKYFISAKMTFS